MARTASSNDGLLAGLRLPEDLDRLEARIGDKLGELPPAQLYDQVCSAAGPREAVHVLRLACRRHPAAGWLIALSQRWERPAGRVHLAETRGLPFFGGVCSAHARAGHVEALVEAGTYGPQPAAALLSSGWVTACVQAGARCIEANPDARLVAALEAIAEEDLDAVLCQLLPHLRSKRAARALRPDLAPYRRASATLNAVLPGLADG